MFTGIIEEVGRIEAIEVKGVQRRLTVGCSKLVRELKQGDSISVSGVCLTAVDIGKSSFTADLAQETWARTSFSRLQPGALVNLELPMRANGRFPGHIVQTTLMERATSLIRSAAEEFPAHDPRALGTDALYRRQGVAHDRGHQPDGSGNRRHRGTGRNHSPYRGGD